MPTIETILVPIDFSLGSSAAVEYAVFLANAFQAAITLFHVYQEPSMLNSIVPGADDRADAEAARASAVRELEQLRSELQLRASGKVQALVEAGSAAPRILGLATRGAFDVIVMGTHGRTGLQRLLLGSVAEAVVRGADRPVVIIPIARVVSRG